MQAIQTLEKCPETRKEILKSLNYLNGQSLKNLMCFNHQGSKHATACGPADTVATANRRHSLDPDNDPL